MASVSIAPVVVGSVSPVSDFRFGLELSGLVVGWFTECGGLTITRSVFPVQEGGVNDYIHQLPGQVGRTNITLKRGVADSTLWDWFQKGQYDGQVERRNISIILLDQEQIELERWNLVDVFPVKWSVSDLIASDNTIAVETIEMVCGDSGESSGGASPSPAPKQQELKMDPTRLNQLAHHVCDLFRQDVRWERDRLGRGWS